MPFRVNDNHWILLVINVEMKIFTVMDPLKQLNELKIRESCSIVEISPRQTWHRIIAEGRLIDCISKDRSTTSKKLWMLTN